MPDEGETGAVHVEVVEEAHNDGGCSWLTVGGGWLHAAGRAAPASTACSIPAIITPCVCARRVPPVQPFRHADYRKLFATNCSEFVGSTLTEIGSCVRMQPESVMASCAGWCALWRRGDRLVRAGCH